MSRGCRQVLTALLVTWQGCRMQTAAKRLVSGCSGASTVGGTGPGGVLRYFILIPTIEFTCLYYCYLLFCIFVLLWRRGRRLFGCGQME